MIIHKGIAGLGNRFQVLAACCATGHNVFADWRDSSFRGRFSDVFESGMVSDFEPGSISGPVYPEWWSSRIDSPCAKVLAGDRFQSAQFADARDHETIVVCKYLADYPLAMLRLIRPNNEAYQLAESKMQGIGQYHCWHVRATDKSGDTDAIIQRIMDAEPGMTKVVITDSQYVRDCLSCCVCPSDIPTVPKRGGIHHMRDDDLAASGLTKKQLNLSAVADIIIGVRATVFEGTCPNSSYSELIENARKEGSWIIQK
jgi:hypothetical protein